MDDNARHALTFFLAHTAIGAGILIFLKTTGREAWLSKAGRAMQ